MGQQLLLDFDQELDEGIPVEDSYGQTPARNLSPSVTAATAAVQDGGSYMAPQHPSDKIVDVGEIIWGARKDMVLYLTRMNAEITFEALVKKPLSQLFKRLDLRKAVEQGTLREKDARFYETLLTFIDSHKPRMSQSDVRRKERWSSYESPVDKWAKTTLEGIKAVNAFVMAPEAERDAIIEKELGNPFLDSGEGNHLPNPLWVVWEALDRLDYRSGDKVDIPFPVVKWQSYLDSFTLTDLKEDKSHGHYSSVDSAIDSISYITRIKSGDVEQEHPLAFFSISPTRAEYGDTGQFAVVWGGFYNSRREVFDNRETAESFAGKKKDPHIIPLQKIVNRTDYVIDFVHPVSGDKYRVSDRTFATRDDAEDFLQGNYNVLNDAVNLRLSKELEKKGERRQLRPEDVVYAASTYGKGGWRYSVMIDKKYANNFDQPLILKDFDDREDAERFLVANRDSILNIVKGYLADKKKIVFFDTGKNSRIGEDYRQGRDVGAEDFMNEFGFRGVQFGNWTNQDDRQMAVNQAYDSFHDLAKLLGVSPMAISFNGELGIAFGARGSGNAAAHYEPGEVVINLTKTNGAGSLAHEWWHALDNYFARQAGVRIGHVTEYRSIPMRDSLRAAFDVLVDRVEASDYRSRSVKCGKYWGDIKEVTARLFAEWVDQELKDKGERNTFLSTGINPEPMQRLNYLRHENLMRIAGREPMTFEEYRGTKESLVGIPYPTAEEVHELGSSVRSIFDIVEERADRDNGRVAMFHRVSEGLPEGVSSLESLVTDKERGLRDGLVDIMRSAGIEVSTDWELGQRVLNDYLDKKNDNTDYLTLVFSKKGKKNNESTTKKSDASELGPPTPKDAALANVGTKIVNKSECVKRLSELFDYIDQKKTLGPHELLHEIVISFDSSLKKEQASFVSTDSSKYFNFENGSTLRVSDHKGNVELFALRNNYYNNYGLVIKLSPSRFIGNDEVDYLEYVYYPDKLKDNARQKAIVAGLREFVETGDFTRLPEPDKIWMSGKEKNIDSTDIKKFRTDNGEAYGFTLAGKVYIDPKIATSETPIHEYSHLWAAALRSGNPEEWKNVVSLMKECKPLWEKVKTNYPELKTDDEIADEVLAHYSGSRGAERLREEQKVATDTATDEMQREGIASMFDKVREALGKFWNAVADMLHIHYKSAEEVADRVLYDLLNRSILEERINPQDARQDVPDYRIRFSQTIKDSPVIDGVSTETIQSVEQRLGDEKITSRNYSEKIAHINELFKFYQSGVQENLPYREVFPTPTLDDYYIDTEVVFKSIGSKVSFESTADNKLALPPSVVKAGKDNLNQWRKMKESGQFEFHESPNYLSGSQYLIDRQSGDIYRYSSHWGKVASCNWDIDADEIQFLFLIGKANIKDFRSHASFKYQAENPDWKAGYAAALAKTVENYKALLNSRIQMTSVVRKQVSDTLQMYEGLVDSLNDSGHIENRYNLRMSKVGMSLPVTDDKREMNKDNDKSPTTEKSDNPLNDTITMEQQEQKNEQQQVQKQSGVERHAEILIAGLERAMQKDGLFVNEQQKARPMIYGKDYRLGGVNSLVMALRSDEAGYKTNAYLLFNDVQKRGEAVRKGQTNTPIIWVNRNEYVSKENPEDRIDARQFKELGPAEQAKYRLNPREDAIAAFNIDQTTMRSAHKTEYENFVSAYAGFEKQDSYLSETDMALRKEVNDFLKQMKANLVPIHNDKQKTGVVSYDENRDVIVLPSQKNFESYNDYVQAAVGHVVMATSIPGRLNRDNRDEQRESLVQDLTTAVKMLDFGLPAKLRPETMESLPQLIGKMKDDPRFAEGIIRDVNRTYSMITKAELGSRIEVRPVPSVESSPEKYHAVTMVKDDENKWTLVMKPEEGPVLAVHPFGKDTARYFDEVKSGSKESVEEMRTELARKYYALATEKKIPTVNLFESKASQEELALISKVNMIKVQDGKMLLVAHVDGEKQKPAVITQEQWNRLWLAGDKQSYKTHLAATLYADVIAAKLAAGIQTAKVQAEDQAKRANEKQTQQVEQAKKQEEEKRRNSPEQKEKERREEQAKKELTKAETKAVAAVALAPMFQQFLDIKGRNSDRILLMHVDDRYETYQDDARKVSKLAQLPLQKSASAKDAEGKPVLFVSFPEHKLDTYLPMLVRHNESVALADDLTRPKAEKEQPEVMRQNPVEKNVEQTLTEQRGGGMRR